MLSDKEKQTLVKLALEAQQNAYAPYSGFHVGAAVRTESGAVYTGCNVENASYPAGICAENNAVTNAIGNGEHRITAVAIIGGKNHENKEFCPPCGICRQVIREFADPDTCEIILAKGNDAGIIKTVLLRELLPDSFGPDAFA